MKANVVVPVIAFAAVAVIAFFAGQKNGASVQAESDSINFGLRGSVVYECDSRIVERPSKVFAVDFEQKNADGVAYDSAIVNQSYYGTTTTFRNKHQWVNIAVMRNGWTRIQVHEGEHVKDYFLCTARED
ncbi:hypothetical protein ACK16A_11035 [Klebsiella michiganensis]|uniref:hypothetical protein n=1 Tax=Klebsiella michiganensis TaxID=1134687 RepID=UPI0039711599